MALFQQQTVMELCFPMPLVMRVRPKSENDAIDMFFM